MAHATDLLILEGMPSEQINQAIDLEQTMKECAIVATQFVHANCNLLLDFSEASIALVDQVLDELHQKIVLDNEDPIDPKIVVFISNWLGGYVGEVFKQHYGGVWKFDLRDPNTPAIELAFDQRSMAFPGRVFHHLLGGAESSILFYYEQLSALYLPHYLPHSSS